VSCFAGINISVGYWQGKEVDMRAQDILKLIGAIVVCQAAGIIGAIFTTSAIPVWYAGLHKASFNPPGWVFGPVWTILYLMMGISLFLVWSAKGKEKYRKPAIMIFSAQLVLNTFWSVVFFGLHSPFAGFVVILLLFGAIALTIERFKKVSAAAAYLLVPYLLWVAFATILNLMVVILN
jgi:translocator protein